MQAISVYCRGLGPSIALSIALCASAGAGGAASFENSAEHVRIIGIDYLRDGGDKAIIRIVIDPGYHINANPASENYLIPTALNITGETASRVIYPTAVKFKPQFAESPIDVYEGSIQIIVERTKLASAAPPRLSGTVTVQACTDQICLPPADLPLPAN